MHLMRLRSPWQKNVGVAAFERVELPDQGDEVTKQATYRRRFNRPTGLEPDQSVWLIIHKWSGSLESVSVNGQLVPPDESGDETRFEITSMLQLHNELELILMANNGEPPRLIGPVELGIL